MRRLVLYLAVAALMLLMGQAAFAESNITVTVTLEQLAVSVAPTTWLLGTRAAEEVVDTTAGAGFTATNDGNVDEDISIAAGLSSPSSWEPEPTAGTDDYVMDVSTNDGGDWTNLNDSATLATSVAPDGTQAFDLRFQCPSSDSTYDAGGESILVSLSAVAS